LDGLNAQTQDIQARAYLAAGNISKFVETLKLPKLSADETNEQYQDRINSIISQIESGDLTELPKELQEYAALIYDTFYSARTSVVNSMISAVGGGNGRIKVTDANKAYLEKLKDTHGDWFTGDIPNVGDYVVVSAQELGETAEQFMNVIVGTFETTEEKINALS